ncbi:uncharacterized protein F4812DRAFT_29354 [Daldinia caldariorum]|uniref:uncharacterized protein n=1 Tax=Daldinia caldariorum TaxID=326644 RepID=UPI00200856CB|nr:uncharacterized protein F4812DRAFT_29354 [Daldinia caldariorum]KAI1472857.1 hypothetical protein F4812DRAFT_29354 [Daldinia caldariorum]
MSYSNQLNDQKHFRVAAAVDEVIHNNNALSGEVIDSAQSRKLKRNREVYEENDNSSLPTAPSSSPFQTLRVTKSSIANSSNPLSKLQNIQAQHNREHPYTPNSIDASLNLSHGNPASTAVVRRTTSLAHLTTFTALSSSAHPRSGAGNDHKILGKPTVYNLNADASEDFQDEYPLDSDLMEEDMACLLETSLYSAQEAHMPPSSVTQAWDHDSRSAAEYDPTLQHSSPKELGVPQMVDAAETPDSNQDDLLDEDVDWNVVYTMTSTISKAASGAYRLQNATHPWLQDRTTQEGEIDKCDANIADTMPLKPFARPPFPEKVRDRSAVSELSPRMVLRTCFRIGELVNQAIYCLNHRQDVIFELFARVTYSSRESLQRNQHFQFVDLFKDQLPYPVGVLSNWRVDTQLDRQSAAFLGTSAGPRLCRCMCKPRRDPKTAIGLTLVITAIKKIDWVDIRLAKRTVCGRSDDAA